MNPAITINGKPLHYLTDSDILEQLAKEAESQLSEKEEEAGDAATD